MKEMQEANAGDARDTGLIPGSGNSPGIGNGNPHQNPCQENSMDRGAWGATELDMTEHTHTHTYTPPHTIPILTLVFLKEERTQTGISSESSTS